MCPPPPQGDRNDNDALPFIVENDASHATDAGCIALRPASLSLSLSGIPLHTESLAVLVVRSTVCTKRMAIRTTRVRHRLNMGMYIPAEIMTIVLGLPRWRFVFGTDEMSNPLWLPGTSPGQSRHEIFISYKWR